MTPSNDTVVRFIALYESGFDMSVTSLILGYGYQDKGGLSHRKLITTYEPIESSVGKYAGYLCIEDGSIKVFSGGSMTLGIADNPELSTRLERDLKKSEDIRQKVFGAISQITAGEIEHTKISVGMDLMDYLESAKKSLFRWESLQEYRVEGEDEGMDEWWDFIERKTKEGVVMERVRRIVFPMNEYTEKEVATHKLSVTHGDDIRYIDALEVGKDFPSCFWLVDDTTVLKMNYGPEGEYYGFDVDTNASPFIDFKKRILAISHPIIEL